MYKRQQPDPEIQKLLGQQPRRAAAQRYHLHRERLLHRGCLLYTSVGRSDITDVLTNTAGGLLGLAVYSMAARLIRNRIKANRLFSILAGIVSVVVIGLLGLLLFANR